MYVLYNSCFDFIGFSTINKSLTIGSNFIYLSFFSLLPNYICNIIIVGLVSFFNDLEHTYTLQSFAYFYHIVNP